ncbi:hypothetical protein G3I40_12005 [Streptomyces sp. SID14478]|uniref:hypothetical protein n=1 Tax=Streptomyces sp. SID14478 TaxID=2706073 RepID=UPI0013D93341|nr:hypothetical protein [Streptomyces sp. SID14478]NEB75939.1 hypothetical protein [Streptomyces sp. SID14478]
MILALCMSGKGKAPEADPAVAVLAAVKVTRTSSAYTSQKIVLDPGVGQSYEIDVTGGFDLAADKGALKVHMLHKPGDASVREVFADGKVYVSDMPQLRKGDWATMPRARTEAHYALRGPVNDPEFLLQQTAKMREVSDIGAQTIGGVRTTHYRGALDHAALTDRMAADSRKRMDQAWAHAGEDLPVSADVWVDGRGRVVRTRAALNVGGVRVTNTLNLSDHGEPVSVKVPAQTVPVGGLSGPFLG